MLSDLEPPVRTVIELLVAKDYERLVSLTNGRRLSAEQIEFAIDEYGRHLVLPPDKAFADDLDAISIIDSDPPSWSVRMHLWTAEEGESDLSIDLTIEKDGSDFSIQFEDILVF